MTSDWTSSMNSSPFGSVEIDAKLNPAFSAGKAPAFPAGKAPAFPAERAPKFTTAGSV